MEKSEGVKDVYQITDIEGKKSIWTRIGSAYTNKDDSLNVVLTCLPINGRLHIRERSKKNGNGKE